jgi:iron complex transport system substrate-binding protein
MGFSLRSFALGLLFLLSTAHCSAAAVSYAEDAPKRIISLAPNITEILFALGLGDRIVGVTSFCDYPAEAARKARIGGMSNPSLEAIVSLKPDVVVVTTDGNPKEVEERLRAMHIKTYVFRARRISELPEGILDLGKALGVREKAAAFASDVESEITQFTRRQSGRTHKKVLFILWPDPLIVAGPGSIADDAIHILGAENIAFRARSAYPKYSIEEILYQDPDVVFIGKGKGMESVSRGILSRLKSVPAVRNRRVFYVGAYLYRLGPRTVTGIRELEGYLRDTP